MSTIQVVYKGERDNFIIKEYSSEAIPADDVIKICEDYNSSEVFGILLTTTDQGGTREVLIEY